MERSISTAISVSTLRWFSAVYRPRQISNFHSSLVAKRHVGLRHVDSAATSLYMVLDLFANISLHACRDTGFLFVRRPRLGTPGGSRP